MIPLDAASGFLKKVAIFTDDYAELHNWGFADTTITIKPKSDGAIIDFKGTYISKVIIERDETSGIKGRKYEGI